MNKSDHSTQACIYYIHIVCLFVMSKFVLSKVK